MSAPFGVAGPDVYWLLDEQGRPKRYLNMPYEAFRRALMSTVEKSEGQSSPRSRIEAVNIRANEVPEGFDCRIEIEVVLAADGWSTVDLRFGDFICTSTSISSDRIKEHVAYDPTSQSYVATLHGEAGEQRTILLNGAVTPAAERSTHMLVFDGPVAPTEIEVSTLLSDLNAFASEGNQLSIAPAEPSGTALRVTGRGGRTTLTWSPADGRFGRAALLEVEGLVVATIESAKSGAIRYDATLSLRWLGEPADRVVVRLPNNAKLVGPYDSTQYDLAEINGPADATRQLVEVRFHNSDAAGAEVQLSAEATIDDLREPAQVAVGAFDVLGAVRQHGLAALRISRNVHHYQDLEGAIELASDTAAERFGAAVAEAFAYSSTDYLIRLHTQPRVRSVRVHPRHTLQLTTKEARLTTEFEFDITGGRTPDLRIALNGWSRTEDPIESQDAIDLADIHVTRDGLLILPLKDPEAQRVRVRFTARRDAAIGLNKFALPTAQFAYPLSGVIELRGETVVIEPRLDLSAGVGTFRGDSRSLASSVTESGGGSGDDAIQLQTYLVDPSVAVNLSERQRPTMVDSSLTVTPHATSASVRQTFEFDFGERENPSVQLALPVEIASLWRSAGVQAMWDEVPINAADVAIDSSSRLLGRTPEAAAILSLPTPPSAERPQLSIEYSLDRDLLAVRQSEVETLGVPVVRVVDATQTTVADVKPGAGDGVAKLAQTAAGQNWEPAASDATGKSSRFVESNSGFELPLVLATPRSFEEQAVFERAWAQTWLSASNRQDRYVYLLRAADAVKIELPTNWDLEQLEILVDGQPANIRTGANRSISVLTPISDSSKLRTLEFRRQVDFESGLWKKLILEWPVVSAEGAVSRGYWQIVTPANKAVGWAASDLFDEHTIGWQGLAWGRRPILSQNDLERWTQLNNSVPLPPGANQYLYSFFGLPRCEVYSFSVSWFTAAACTLCFATILLCLRLRLGASIGFWIVVAIAAVTLASSHPEILVAAFQTILGGCVMLLAALSFRRMFSGFARRPAPSSSMRTDALEAPTRVYLSADSRSSRGVELQPSGPVSAGESHG